MPHISSYYLSLAPSNSLFNLGKRMKLDTPLSAPSISQKQTVKHRFLPLYALCLYSVPFAQLLPLLYIASGPISII